MNIAILGGTSHVATELCLILREWGHDVTPTARSRVSASFLREQGCDPVIGDVTNQMTVREAADEADVIVIAAFARQYSKGFAPREAHQTNEAIVENAVATASESASLVYFSTIAIYGEETGFSRFDSYAREKRRIEQSFFSACEEEGKDGFAFRMGPVYGPNQGNTQELREKLSRHTKQGVVHVDVGADRLSNVVHTVTVADAITQTHSTETEEKLFTVVNDPQWTWGDIFEHYAPAGTEVIFHPREDSGSGSLFYKVVSWGAAALESNERALRSFSIYFPKRINERIFNEYVNIKSSDNLNTFDNRGRISLSQFDQGPIPGKRLKGLSATNELIRDSSGMDGIKQENTIDVRKSGTIINF